MKAIMMSIRPEWIAKILNGEKTIEIRKKFPSDYVGWVYIYCTKENELVYFGYGGRYAISLDTKEKIAQFDNWELGNLNDVQWFGDGKVVARFWCDRVDEILSKENGNFYTNFLSNRKLLTQSCLTQREMFDYLAGNWHQKFNYWYGGYAIHITEVKPFDKTKEISEFHKVGYFKRINEINIVGNPSFAIDYENAIKQYAITRAPQSWCYIEV